MKKILKYIMVVLITGSFLNSCETTDLDLTTNPNQLTTGNANLLLNSVQLAYNNNMQTFNNIGGGLTRIHFVGGRDYFNNYAGNTFDGAWSRTYSNLFANLNEMVAINAESDLNYDFHVAISKVMQAHSLLLLVNNFAASFILVLRINSFGDMPVIL